MGKNTYSKHPDDPMTLREIEIWHSQEVEVSNNPSTKGRRGKTWNETMTELNVSNKAITHTKKKSEYNAQTQAMLEQKQLGIEQYVDGLIKLTKAEKGVTLLIDSPTEGSVAKIKKRLQEPDNVTRMNAISEVGDIFGAKAPKQVDLKHSMAAMSDEEIQEGIDKSIKEIESDGRIQRTITGSLDAKTAITSTIAFAESSVDISAGEQAVCPTDT